MYMYTCTSALNLHYNFCPVVKGHGFTQCTMMCNHNTGIVARILIYSKVYTNKTEY